MEHTQKKPNLKYLIQLALLTTILLVMNITGLAMIPLPGQYASIMTVPVAVGAIMMGPLAGAILGGVMGCISFYTAVTTGFSTLFLAGYTGGTVVALSLLNTIVPRVLMGLCTGLIYRLARRLDKRDILSYYIGGIAAPLLNTLFYMTVLVLIFLNAPTLQNLLGEELMAAFRDNILLFVAAYVGIQAVLEAVVGCLISGSVCKALRVVLKR